VSFDDWRLTIEKTAMMMTITNIASTFRTSTNVVRILTIFLVLAAGNLHLLLSLVLLYIYYEIVHKVQIKSK